eukprot:scaffold162577_cov31-Tisochrysis_lutea.AAC.5
MIGRRSTLASATMCTFERNESSLFARAQASLYSLCALPGCASSSCSSAARNAPAGRSSPQIARASALTRHEPSAAVSSGRTHQPCSARTSCSSSAR